MKSDSKLSSLTVFFPCYDEESNIEPLTQQLLNLLPQITKAFEIIIVDDGSTDNTAKIASTLSRKHSHVRVVSHAHNLGYGASIQTGIAAAAHDWIFYTDGDRQFDVAELKTFLRYTQNYQAIIGYRKKRADGQVRAFNAYLFKLFIDVLYRLHVRDIDCAFKLYKTRLVQELTLITSGAMISTEILYRLKKKGIKVKQLPVDHYPRQYGQPTGNHPKVVLKAGIEAIKLYIHLKFNPSSK